MNINICNDCKHKTKEDIYNYQECIRCKNNPFVIDDRFDAKEIEIRPEKAGELWTSELSKEYVTVYNNNELCFYDLAKHRSYEYLYFQGNEKAQWVCRNEPVHGKNGWKRLFPKPEDESVERIEIEGVEFGHGFSGTQTGKNLFIKDHKGGGNYRKLMNRAPMKMILEIPKEG